MDELSQAKQIRIVPDGPPFIYHTLQVPAEEMEQLMANYEPAFVASLNSIWQNKDRHREKRRTSIVKELDIPNPQINLLAGAQPAYLQRVFPDEVWRTGISRRMLMIYANKRTEKFDIFEERTKSESLREQILSELTLLSTLYGQMKWEPAAGTWVREWSLGSQEPAPKHSKLTHYLTTRSEYIIRLSMIAAISARRELVIRMDDVIRARGWLFDAEKKMADIFREMIGKSDREIVDELHRFVQALWAKDSRKPISGSTIRFFLYDRTPSDKIEGLMLFCERANILARAAAGADLWIPRQRPEPME